jgi:deoxyribose-phosphate aldolase
MILAEHIDHICLKPDTTIADVEKLSREAIDYKFKTICVPPLFVKIAKAFTVQTNVKVAAAIAFPFGYSAIEAKIAEIVLAIVDGADELEMVINTGAVKNSDWHFLASEINTIMPVIKSNGKSVTVIFETALMTETEIITACDVYGAAGVDFVKAGTGTIENLLIADQVKLIRKHLAETVKIKVATDVKNYRDAENLITAGGNRLSCNNSLSFLQQPLQQPLQQY